MNGHIYKIVNSVNDKVYIGQTKRTIDFRYRQHICTAKSATKRHSAIHNAMLKYGIENFHVELIEDCPIEQMDEREMYWIEQYDSFRNGYNRTVGGEKGVLIDEDEIIALWNDGYSVKDIHLKTNHDKHIIKEILLERGITRDELKDRRNTVAGMKRRLPVYQYDRDGNFIREFTSIFDAADAYGTSHWNIRNSVFGNHKTACGYQWSTQKHDNIGAARKQSFPGGRKAVYIYSADGDYIRSYSSMKEAAHAIGRNCPVCIRNACRGVYPLYKGYQWRFEKHDKIASLNNMGKL